MNKMKIKKSRKRIIVRFLVRVGLMAIIIVSFCFVSVRRIEGDAITQDYRDGDLVFEERWGKGATFLLIRVRSFED